MKKTLVGWLCLVPFVAQAALTLCRNGGTDYVIVTPDRPSPKVTEAIEDMQGLLKQSTGADFPVIPPAEADRHDRRIFVGFSDAMRNVAGAIEEPANEERVFRTIGDDILIYGGGRCGTAFALYQFLEEKLGMRFYHFWGDTHVPTHDTLTLEPFDRSVQPSFLYRILRISHLRVGGCPTAAAYARRSRMHDLWSRWVPMETIGSNCHTLFRLVPPHGTAEDRPPMLAPPYPIFRDTNYFETHPEYFSLSQSGERSDREQLCFSNPGLRRLLTENVEKYLVSRGVQPEDHAVIGIDQGDQHSGRFCWCEDCRALEEKYQSPGGPLYDYLIETASPYFKERYPNLILRFLAYRARQTEVPPAPETLPGGRLPENLCPFLAMLYGDFSKPWNAPSNQAGWNNLLGWSRVSHHPWLYYYPTTYARPMPHMPLFGNVGRVAEEYRLAHGLNARFIYVDQESYFMRSNIGFVALNLFLQSQIANDVTRDVPALVSEYMNAIYGSAAPMMERYFTELERRGAEDDGFLRWNPDPRFAEYVTPANLLRWQNDFDEMERRVAAEPRALLHVRAARTNLDQNTLLLWQDGLRKIPDWASLSADEVYERYQRTLDLVKEHTLDVDFEDGRIGRATRQRTYDATVKLWRDTGKHFYTIAKGGRPLPEMFDRVPAEDIRQATLHLNKLPLPFDDEAAFGVAVITDAPANGRVSFRYRDHTGTHPAVSRTVTLTEGEPYTVYYVGRVKLSRDSTIHVPAPRVYTHPLFGAVGGSAGAFVGHAYDASKPDREWDVYASCRLRDGQVYTDRVILVKTDGETPPIPDETEAVQ